MNEQVIDRRGYIGGSDIAAIVGVSPWNTPAGVWLEKTAPQAIEDATNMKAKRRGSRLEPYIIDMIRDEYGIDVDRRNQRYFDTDVPHFACEIDAESGNENIEIKTVHPFAAGGWGAEDTDQIPVHYVAQVQWGMGILRRHRCNVFALIGDDLRRYVVDADQDVIASLRETAEAFWQRYVLGNLRPPIDYQDPKTLDTLAKLYPGTDGSTIESTPAVDHWRAVMDEAREKVAAYQTVVDVAKAHLLDVMGKAAQLKFNDGKAFRRKLVQAKPYTVEARSYMDFRLVNVKE